VSGPDAADHRASAGTRATVLGVAVLVVAVLVGLLVGPVRIGAANILRWLFSFGDAPPGMSEQQALILAENGAEIGLGLVAYDAADARKIVGRKSSEIPAILGFSGRDEIVHRDDLVLRVV